MKASLILAAVLAAPALAFMPAAPLQQPQQPQRATTVARAQGNVQMLNLFNAKKGAAGGKGAKTFTITVQQKFYKEAEVGGWVFMGRALVIGEEGGGSWWTAVRMDGVQYVCVRVCTNSNQF